MHFVRTMVDELLYVVILAVRIKSYQWKYYI
jgi:hypothetical protein